MLVAIGSASITFASTVMWSRRGDGVRALIVLYENLKRGDQFTWCVFGVAVGGAIGMFAFYKLFSNDEWSL